MTKDTKEHKVQDSNGDYQPHDKKKPGRPELVKSPLMGLHVEMRSTEMTKIYQGACSDIETTAAKNIKIVTKEIGGQVGALAREQKSQTKTLDRAIADKKQIAHNAFVIAKRAAQSEYDREMHKAETDYNDSVRDMRAEFTKATQPLEMALKNKTEQIAIQRDEVRAAFTTEFKAMFDQRVTLEKQDVADARKRAEENAVKQAEHDAQRAAKVAGPGLVAPEAPANTNNGHHGHLPVKGSVAAAIG